jgi:chromosome partitioning protein
MPVFAIVGNKGGAGKTTLSVNLASAFNRDAATALVDADPQGSSLQWRVISGNEDAVPVYEAEEDLQQQVSDLQQQFDNVLVDCPPSVHARQTDAVLKFSNAVLIPVQPSPMDLWATVHIEQAVNDSLDVNPLLKSMLVINQMEVRTTMSKLVREALGQIELTVADTAIRRRAVYRHSILYGKSVFEMGSLGRAAVAEIEQLIEEIKAL